MTYIEPNDGREHFEAGGPQSDKPCDKCIYYDRDICSDDPCGLCYESADKFNWEEGEVAEDERVGTRLEEVGRKDSPGGSPYM
jgi:hypothetical protein